MNKFEKILLSLFFIELFVGGGGRLIEIGPLSIRQVLFGLLLATFVVRIIRNRALLNKDINTFLNFNVVTIGIYLLIGWFFVSAIIGYINGHPLSIIITDLFRVAFFAAYFPLSYYISEQRFSRARIISILKWSALIVAIFTIIVSLLGKTVFSGNFKPFYDFMNSIMNDDLFFRPSNSVFYKSHIFVFIGLIIALNELLNKKVTWFDSILVALGTVSIIWSETRGFLLAIIISVISIIFIDVKVLTDPIKGLLGKFEKVIQSKQLLKKIAILIAIMVSLPFLYQHMTLERFEQDKHSTEVNMKDKKSNEEVNDVSVNKRLEFIVDSKKILLENPAYLVFGSGYGTEIAGRTTGIEMSFLDILVEQGILGLLIWFFLFLLVYYNYYKPYKQGEKLASLEVSLMSAFMGLLLMTNINPFINNPIGIVFFLIVLVVSKNKMQSTLKEH